MRPSVLFKAVYDYASPYVVSALQKQHDEYIQRHFEDVIQHAKRSRGGVYLVR